MKVKRTYRIEQELTDKLARFAEEDGKTVTDVLEEAIRAYGTMPDDCHTLEGEESGAVKSSATLKVISEELAMLRGQLKVKDDQISTLSDALTSAQETLKASQVLHAGALGMLESVEQKKRRRFRWPWSK